MKQTRKELMAEIFRTIEVDKIFAAAGFMWRHRRHRDAKPEEAINVTPDELADFVEGLSKVGLECLRDLALDITGGREQ